MREKVLNQKQRWTQIFSHTQRIKLLIFARVSFNLLIVMVGFFFSIWSGFIHCTKKKYSENESTVFYLVFVWINSINITPYPIFSNKNWHFVTYNFQLRIIQSNKPFRNTHNKPSDSNVNRLENIPFNAFKIIV